MKTERQMYEEYISAQEARLEALLQQANAIQKDIDNVTTLMLKCPYVVPQDD
jgi:hypothetical protein